jgi:Flp pilus assembly protein TadG
VADAQGIGLIGHERGQVLAFFAILLPIVLLPLAAYAVDAAFISTRAAGLQGATNQAAEAAAQQLDIGAFRSRSALTIEPALARAAAVQSINESEPAASVTSVRVNGALVTVTAVELVRLPLNFMPAPAITLEAHASARLVGGYDSPSSRLPLPTSTF